MITVNSIIEHGNYYHYKFFLEYLLFLQNINVEINIMYYYYTAIQLKIVLINLVIIC